MIWHSVKDFYPGDNVKHILLYFGGSQNILLIDRDKEENKRLPDVFKAYTFERKRKEYTEQNSHYIDWPTHWMEIKNPAI
jgi:hypothetical protein